jgi:hypothetical protein
LETLCHFAYFARPNKAGGLAGDKETSKEPSRYNTNASVDGLEAVAAARETRSGVESPVQFPDRYFRAVAAISRMWSAKSQKQSQIGILVAKRSS